MAEGWTTTASETRVCFPYRSIEDLITKPEVQWEWRESDGGEWRIIEEPRLVPPRRLETATWIRGRLALPTPVARDIEDRLERTPLAFGVAAQSSGSRSRAVEWADFADGSAAELRFEPRDWRGTITIAGVGATTGPAPEPSPDLPKLPGCRVWTSTALHLVLDESAPSFGGGFDVQWAELDGDLLYHLRPRSDDGIVAPTLFLNSREPKLSRVWNSKATTGRDARLRDLLNATVAVEVMSELAMLADGIEPSGADQRDVEFKREVHRALEKRFGLKVEEFTGLSGPEDRLALVERLQRSPAVALLGKVAKLVDEVS